MNVPDEVLDQVRAQLEGINAKPFFLSISGSDNYGFASENNSDVDIMGAYYFTRAGDIFNPRNERSYTKEGKYIFEGMKYEWQLHELGKFLRLLGKSNMNMLDWVFSLFILQEPPAFFDFGLPELKTVARNCIDRGFITHTFGWTKHMYNTSWENPKKVLHSIRPLMTALHFLETEEYRTNIQELVEYEPMTKYREFIFQLIELKKNARTTNQIIRHQSIQCYDELKELVSAKEDQIPKRNPWEEELRDLVSYLRLKTLEQHGFSGKKPDMICGKKE
jgi:predicted nucleotidyltransferase